MAYKHLTVDEGKLLSARLSDLRTFSDASIALLTGKASLWNDHAMAKATTNGKTKYLPAPERRFAAFQSALDDAARLIRKDDVFDVFHGIKRELDGNAVPADQLIMADRHSDDVRGQTGLANAFRALQCARSVFIELKRKYGDKLHAPATLTLAKTPKQKADPGELAAARLKAKEQQTLGEMLLAAAASDPAMAALLASMKERLADQNAPKVLQNLAANG